MGTAPRLPSALVTSLLRRRAGLPQVVRVDGRSLRISRWPGGRHVAQVGPVPGEAPPSPELLVAAVDDLAALGFDDVMTTALHPSEHRPFVDAGFAERDRLVLLRRDLTELPPSPPVALRTARRREWPRLAEVDQQAFPPGWGLDASGISDAFAATPFGRVRAAGRPACGYAVSGRSRSRGYLQRLAVEPSASGRGVGRALVIDALRWLAARGATDCLVNTQETNRRALDLYLSLGFAELPERLMILGRSRDEAP
jgi:ribosomal-protein-alanine N-acetyltransferase